MTEESSEVTGSRRRTWLIAALAGGLVLLLAAALAIGIAVSSGPDRADDAAVTRAFITRYATGDPEVCQLATPQLRSQLAADGRCRGEASATEPDVTIQHIQACGTESLAWVRTTPPGRLSKPYASIQLARVDGQWSVADLRVMSEPMPVQPAPCQSSSDDGN